MKILDYFGEFFVGFFISVSVCFGISVWSCLVFFIAVASGLLVLLGIGETS